MVAMASYVATGDDYAGWSTGRNFGAFGLVAGLVGLTGWAALHRHLPGLQPRDAGDQLLIVAMEWVGTGLFVLMAIGVAGSLMLSSKARGTVTVDDVGVARQIGKWRRILRWEEIEGFVVSAYGGVTLIPVKGWRRIEIPRFLDDYRGCIAEIKAHGIGSLPAERLKRKRGWRETILLYCSVYVYLLARDARVSHAGRIVSVCAWVAVFVWVWTDERRREGRSWFGWVGMTTMVGLPGWLVFRMAHTW
jgi:hypothetical protein